MNTFKIEIPEPCHANWADMTVAERGRHCSLCNKVVVDFSEDTPQQLDQKLEEFHAKRTDVCGRFSNEQVSEKPDQAQIMIRFSKLKLNSFQKFLVSMVFAFFLGGFSACKVKEGPMGSVTMWRDGYGMPGIPQHLDDFKKDCNEGWTQGSVVLVRDSTVKYDSMQITVAPKRQLEFAKDSFNLTPASMLFLDQLADSLKTNRNYTVEIIGHTDDRGGEKLNKELSLKRATSVKEYLEKKGIRVDICRGVGYQFPVADNATEKGRATNRRVEILIGRKKEN